MHVLVAGAGGMLGRYVVQRLCDDRGLACWQSQVDGHGRNIPELYPRERGRDKALRGGDAMPRLYHEEAGLLAAAGIKLAAE